MLNDEICKLRDELNTHIKLLKFLKSKLKKVYAILLLTPSWVDCLAHRLTKKVRSESTARKWRRFLSMARKFTMWRRITVWWSSKAKKTSHKKTSSPFWKGYQALTSHTEKSPSMESLWLASWQMVARSTIVLIQATLSQKSSGFNNKDHKPSWSED